MSTPLASFPAKLGSSVVSSDIFFISDSTSANNNKITTEELSKAFTGLYAQTAEGFTIFENTENYGFLSKLEKTIKSRRENSSSDKSYVASLFELGINKIAQKVGEEAVEVIIEAKDNNDKLFLDESADLLFHYLILLQAKGFQLKDVISVLKLREK